MEKSENYFQHQVFIYLRSYFSCKELFISLPESFMYENWNPFLEKRKDTSRKKKKRKKLCIFVRLSPRSLRWATLTVNLILWNCSHKHSISGGSWVFLRHHPRFLHILQTHSKSQMLDSLSQKRGREDF